MYYLRDTSIKKKEEKKRKKKRILVSIKKYSGKKKLIKNF